VTPQVSSVAAPRAGPKSTYGSIERAQSALKLVLLERRHEGTHAVSAQGVWLVDVLLGHLGLDEARMSSIDEHVGVRSVEMIGQVLGIQDCGQLASAIDRVGGEVSVQLFEAFEFGVLRCHLRA